MNEKHTSNLQEHIQSLTQLLSDKPADADTLLQVGNGLSGLVDAAGEADMPGLQDMTLLLDENVRDIIEDQLALGDSQYTLLCNWLQSASDYINNPANHDAAQSLLDNLQDSAWSSALTPVDADIMAELLGVKSAADTPAEQVTTTDTASSQTHPGLASLQSILEQLTPESNDSLTQAAGALEQIAEDAGERELMALQDVCLLMQETLLDAVEDQKQLTAAQIERFRQWPALAGAYLEQPDDAARGHELVGVLTAADWISPMSEEDAAVLREMFGPLPEPETPEPETAEPDPLVSITPAPAENEGGRINLDVSASPVPVSLELVEMLLDEMKLMASDTSSSLLRAATGETETAIRNDSLSRYLGRVDRFGSACQAADLAGLHQASMVLHHNINNMMNSDKVMTDEQLRLLAAWPGLVQDYLADIGTGPPSLAIVDYLSQKQWPEPLLEEVNPALVDLLNAPFLVESETQEEERQSVATAEDVSLQTPDDISAELLEGLLQELPQQTEGFSAAIQSLIDGSGGKQAVEKAQRIAHTVKGAGNTVGIRGIANLTHQLEDILILLNKHERLPSQALSNAMMNAADCLEEMSESLVEQTPAPDNAQEVFQVILDWINRLEKEGVEVLDKDAPVTAGEAADKPDKESEAGEEEKAAPTLRVPAPIIDDIIRILGETIILTTQLQENVRRSSHESESLATHTGQLQGIVSELERQVELRGIVFNQQMAVNQSEVFDPLEMEQYNEMHTLTNQLIENVVDSHELNRNIDVDLQELDELLFQQSRLHRQVQELVMKTRMVPIKTITPRLQRSVRQTCRTTGKQTNLHLGGTETLIDSDVLSNLLDPLMHMLRNAIDHGIESRDERIRKQKSPEGRIDLEFSREGTQIVVRCRDDGAGLNHEAILETAARKGLVDTGEKLDEQEINRLILLPGFSTRGATTQVSGRGIGMDVVNSQIQTIKGNIHIESEKDKGCLFELRLPITLISSHSILIRHRDQILAVSNHGIIQILHPSDSEIIDSEESLKCRFGEEVLDAVNLEELINLPGDRRARPRETRPALLIEDEDVRKIVFMQEILDVRELVIKGMGNYLSRIKGITGATILGDGSVVPVLDVPELIRTQGSANAGQTGQFTQTDIRDTLPTALVVDDSLSARRSLAQVLQDAGYDVRTAKDGLEALEIIKKKKPDILLVDLEMPRMNGMELSSHIRADQATSHIPIIMVTSRSTEKHRGEADNAGVNVYLTKPFNEDDMLDHVSTLLS